MKELTKEQKIKIIDYAIKNINYSSYMCIALDNGYEDITNDYMENLNYLQNLFPKFTKYNYILFYLRKCNIIPLLNSLLYLGYKLWDKPNEIKRRIQFLKYLKTTIK